MVLDSKKFGFNKFSIWEERSLTHRDYTNLLNHLAQDIGKAYVSPNGLHTLYLLAANSKKIDSSKMPDDVITMNSEFILSTDSFQKQLVKVVFPEDIKGKHDISVYSAIGIACLGAKEKSYVSVNQKKYEQALFIEKIVFQPEREKLFNL